MRVVYLLTTADAAGGTERAFISQANWLAQHADVTVLSIFKTADEPHFAIDAKVRRRYVVPRRAVSPAPSLLIPARWDDQFDATADDAIERELRAITADVVVTSTPALALLASRFLPRSVRIIHQEHRNTALRGVGLDPLLACASRLDMIAVLTDRIADWLVAELDAPAPPVVVMPNGIDVREFAQSGRTQPLVVSAGRMLPGKQFDQLLRAFAIATASHPEWRLRVYGDGPAKSSLQVLARRLDLETRLELPGPVEDMERHLAKGSMFALASRSEALPMVILEAQASGVPVVSYDTTTGPREILGATGGGIVVPAGSVQGLASGIRLLIEDEELRHALGAAGRQGAWAFDIDAVMRRWLALITDVVRGRPPAGVHVSLAAEDAAVQVAPATSPDAVRDDVTALLDDRGLAWHLGTPKPTGWRIVTGFEENAAVLDVVSALGRGVFVLPQRGHERLSDPWRAGEDASPLARYATVIELMDGPVGPSLGTIELWAVEDEARRSPTGGDGPAWVDETTWAEWMSRRTATPSGVPYWDDPHFDVDVVYTWVDGDDARWRERRAPYLEDPSVDITSDASRDARYRNRDELYYSIRSVKRYLPWVRNIFIVTDGQTPTRVIREFPDVRVVDHSEIFPDPSVLPVFNSHAIEASLHRIDGLAEHFIYFNDDVLVARPLAKSQFFLPNGLAKFFPHGVALGHGELHRFPHLQAAANNRELIARDFGIEITRSMLHTPHPHLASTIRELEARHPEVFERTRSNRFRSPSDYSVMSSLAQYYGFATGRYVPATIGYRYASLRSDALSSRLRHILDDERAVVVAIAEPMNEDRRHRDENAILLEFLEELVARPEHGSASGAAAGARTGTIEQVVRPGPR